MTLRDIRDAQIIAADMPYAAPVKDGWRNCVSAADPLTFIIALSDLRDLIF